MIYVYLKDIFLLLLPFILSNWAFQYFYQTSIFKVVSWWFNNHNDVDYQGVVYVGVFFVFLAIWVTTGSMVNKVSYALNGEEHDMVYTGNTSRYDARLYHASDLKAPAESDSNLETSSFSFENIYRIITYKRDKGSNRLGVPSASVKFSWFGFISILCFLIALSPLFFALIHSMAHFVIIEEKGITSFNSIGSWKETWSQIFSPY